MAYRWVDAADIEPTGGTSVPGAVYEPLAPAEEG